MLQTLFGSLLAILSPRPIRGWLLRRFMGWEVDRSARFGLCVVSANSLTMGPGSRIGHFTVVRELRALHLGPSATIGQWNWITASTLLTDNLPHATGTLIVGAHSAVTSRHYIDCSGGVDIGTHTTIAGVGSSFISHQIDTTVPIQSVRPITIGSYCLIGSNVRMVPGSSIPERCVIGMGAVVAGTLREQQTLYGGVPARTIKRLPPGGYFERQFGWVGPVSNEG